MNIDSFFHVFDFFGANVTFLRLTFKVLSKGRSPVDELVTFKAEMLLIFKVRLLRELVRLVMLPNLFVKLLTFKTETFPS